MRKMMGPPRLAGIHIEPGAVTMQRLSLMDYIRWAFQVSAGQVSGPAWLNEQRFDIIAKASGPVPEAQLRLMVQSLLAERFKMTFHHETKQLTVYNLMEAKGGTKCKTAAGEGEIGFAPQPDGPASIQRASFAQVADLLSDIVQQPVVDETGLKGRYNCTLDPRPYQPEPGQQPDMIGILTLMLREQFGLRVEQKKTAMDVVVIDHMEKTPTDN
jgi:uncharacterized protein (TIGR03435 family)